MDTQQDMNTKECKKFLKTFHRLSRNLYESEMLWTARCQDTAAIACTYLQQPLLKQVSASGMEYD